LESSSSVAPKGEGVAKVLGSLGSSDPTALEFQAGSHPGRVSIVHGKTAEVTWSDEGGRETTSTCQFATVLDPSPVAGDWVSVRDGYIVAVSPRRTALRRPSTNQRLVQVMAANLDVVLVVVPIDRELNLLLLERLGVMAWDSGARPVVVLTKSDGSQIVDSVVDEARLAVPGVDILTTSSQSGHGIEELRGLLHDGVTAVMLGASGAGKTSLLNALEGTSEVTRTLSRTGEGRHATTTRRLYRLSSGGVLLDIPGIRLLDLMVGQEGVDEAFADITELAQACRFSDCHHDGDEGCAVEVAVSNGTLALRRLESWRAAQASVATNDRLKDRTKISKRRRAPKPEPLSDLDSDPDADPEAD
jgi:ribosome biogenesis GTPase